MNKLSKLALSAFLIAGLAATTALAQSVYLPQIADGGGYVSTVTLVNTGGIRADGIVAFYNQDGTPRKLQIGLTTASTFTVSIPDRGSVRLSTPGTAPIVTSGWAFFNFLPNTVRGLVTFELRSGPLLVSTAGIIAAGASPRILVPVDIAPNGGTGLAIANPGSDAVTVRLRLYDEAGSEVSSTVDSRLYPLAARHQVADFVSNFFSLGASFKGSIAAEVIDDGSIAVTGLTVKEGILSALPAIAAPVPDTGPPSAPGIDVVGGQPSEGPGVFVYVMGIDKPGPSYQLPPAQNWGSIQSIEVQISTDRTFATFPVKKSFQRSYGNPEIPMLVFFSTDYIGTYYFRAKATNAAGDSPWSQVFTVMAH